MARRVAIVDALDELGRLHALSRAHVEVPFSCSGYAARLHPEESLLRYFGEREGYDVAALYDGEPLAYVCVERQSGQILWLVMLGEAAVTQETVRELCDWCLSTYGACWGNVSNDAVRALFEVQEEAHLDGTMVRWVGR